MASKVPAAVGFYNIDIPVGVGALRHIRPAELCPAVVMTRKVHQGLADVSPALLNRDDGLVIRVE